MKRQFFKFLVGTFCLAWLLKNIIAPVGALAFYYDEYLTLSSGCATAMDESWFIEQKGHPQLDKTAQVHLLVCHEYDKTRKVMLSMGLSEDVLSYLGLKALEINQRTAEEFVEQHRFQER